MIVGGWKQQQGACQHITKVHVTAAAGTCIDSPPKQKQSTQNNKKTIEHCRHYDSIKKMAKKLGVTYPSKPHSLSLVQSSLLDASRSPLALSKATYFHLVVRAAASQVDSSHRGVLTGSHGGPISAPIAPPVSIFRGRAADST